MRKRKQRDKTVISLNDNEIKYITLSKNEYGFYVKHFDSANLEEGVIKNGEVLKAEFLSKILNKISKKIDIKSIDLILPHEYFLFDLHKIEKKKNKSNKKILKKYLNENKYQISWARTHTFEYDLFDRNKSLEVLFRCLPEDINSSYQHAFKKAGMEINSIHSDIVSFSSLIYKEKDLTQIFVDHDKTFLLEYRNGVFISDKKFDVSYGLFIQEIKKNLDISYEEARSILNKYGVLRTHGDKDVLKSLERGMKPLLTFLKKNKLKNENPIYVHFSDEPILGFSDRMRLILKTEVHDLCVLCSSAYTFQDVLSIHKKDSYRYEPLIARALVVFNKK